MDTCTTHSDGKTGYMCMKHNIQICDESIHCRDPELYCKYRTSCLIWFMGKNNGNGFDDKPHTG